MSPTPDDLEARLRTELGGGTAPAVSIEDSWAAMQERLDEPVRTYTERIQVQPGVTLAVTEAGLGGEPLIYLHGFTSGRDTMDEWIPGLVAAGHHVAVPDLRGHGDSDKPVDEAAYSFERFADDVLAVVDELMWDRFVLVGHSVGGMIAQVVALKRPEQVSRLVLMNTHHGPAATEFASVLRLSIAVAREQGMDALADLMARSQLRETEAHRRTVDQRPGYSDWLEAHFRSSSPAMYAAVCEQLIEGEDRLERLTGLTIPTLVMVGDQDQPFLESSSRIAAAMPEARLRVLGAGHNIMFEAPVLWWATLQRFLSETAA